MQELRSAEDFPLYKHMFVQLDDKLLLKEKQGIVMDHHSFRHYHNIQITVS